jgi:radical SAM-linked protein
MRIRVHFSKTEAMRFTGHLDLFKTLERTIRRAALPLVYSQGFRPHPRINLACALPLGITSECELADIWLQDELPLDMIQDSLTIASPPGITIDRVEQIAHNLPSVQSTLLAAEYLITFYEDVPDLQQQIEVLLDSTSIPRIRHSKKYDLRPLILGIVSEPDDADPLQHLRVKLTAMEGATGRPDELILALGHNPHEARIHRTQLVYK